jgi:outer membrane protein OmpA-like peptidoglycan-associated protein
VNLGVDIGLTGTHTFVHEIPATPPYMVYLGLSYSYDPHQRVIERVREVEVETEPETPPTPPVIAGQVIDASNQQGIAHALVTFPGRDVTTLATGTDGRFVSWPLQAGQVTVHVEHPEYNPADCTATLPDTGQTELQCSMTPLPRRGTLAGHVTSEDGAAVAGANVVIGHEGGAGGSVSVTTGVDGRFEREIDAGTYSVQVEADGYLRRGGQSVEIRARERSELDIQLRAQPRTALVRIQGDQIRIMQAVHFRTNSAEIDPDSFSLLEQVADIMLRNPDMCHIEVQGHTDSSGTPQRNTALSQERAESVVAYLVQTGVSTDRLNAHGYGPDVPVAPNITAAGRSRNRRVEFHITERCGAGGVGAPAPTVTPALAPALAPIHR